MSAVDLLFGLALAGGAVWLARGVPRVALAVLLVGGSVGLGAIFEASRRPLESPPIPPPEGGALVGSQACRACHPREYGTWHESYHRTMTQAATPEAVLGRFPAKLRARAMSVHLSRQDSRFYVTFMDAGGSALGRHRIEMTTGSHHFQNYWFRQGDFLFQLPFLWLIDEGRWIPVEDSFLQPSPKEATPKRWADGCINCHAVGGQRDLSSAGDEADTRVVELGISCEACHDGGREHVIEMRSPARRLLSWVDGERSKVANPAHLPAAESRAACGRCHSLHIVRAPGRMQREGDDFQVGEPLARTRQVVRVEAGPDAPRIRPAHGKNPRIRLSAGGQQREWPVYALDRHGIWLSEGPPEGPATLHLGTYALAGRVAPDGDKVRFFGPPLPPPAATLLSNALGYRLPQEIFDDSAWWNDGTCRVAGREYNALEFSGCASEVSCVSCHKMHGSEAADQLDPERLDDANCTQCHSEEKGQAHTHHFPASAGARCLNCHMPHVTYGLLGAIRSHRIDSPTAAQTAIYRRPNACNLCHLDKPLAWTAKHLERWYGQVQPPLKPDHQRLAEAVRGVLGGDAVVRAIYAWSMAWPPALEASGRWVQPHLVSLLEDPYAAVRAIAIRTLRQLNFPGAERYDFVGPPSTRAALRAEFAARPAADPRQGPELGLSKPGVLEPALLKRLVEARDDRNVRISE